MQQRVHGQNKRSSVSCPGGTPGWLLNFRPGSTGHRHHLGLSTPIDPILQVDRDTWTAICTIAGLRGSPTSGAHAATASSTQHSVRLAAGRQNSPVGMTCPWMTRINTARARPAHQDLELTTPQLRLRCRHVQCVLARPRRTTHSTAGETPGTVARR